MLNPMRSHSWNHAELDMIGQSTCSVRLPYFIANLSMICALFYITLNTGGIHENCSSLYIALPNFIFLDVKGKILYINLQGKYYFVEYKLFNINTFTMRESERVGKRVYARECECMRENKLRRARVYERCMRESDKVGEGMRLYERY